MSRLPDGTPVLCKQCGGEADLGEDLSVRCGYCGASDVLPSDELGRALDLRARLALAAGRVAQLEGMDAALASIFTDRRAVLRVVGAYLAVGLFSLVTTSSSIASLVFEHGAALGAAQVLDAAAASLLTPLVLLSTVAWAGIAMARGGRVFTRTVRPLLQARPPAAAGAPFGCRACGGPLPRSADAAVACTYCRTKNLVPEHLHGTVAAAVDARAGALRAQAHAASAGTTSVAQVVRTTFLVGSITTGALLVLAVMALRVLTHAA